MLATSILPARTAPIAPMCQRPSRHGRQSGIRSPTESAEPPKSCREAEERMGHRVLDFLLSLGDSPWAQSDALEHFPRAQDVDFRGLVGARSSSTTRLRAGSSRADFRHAEVDAEVRGGFLALTPGCLTYRHRKRTRLQDPRVSA